MKPKLTGWINENNKLKSDHCNSNRGHYYTTNWAFPFYCGENCEEATDDAGQGEEVDESQEGEVVDGVDDLGVRPVEPEDQLPVNKGEVGLHLQPELRGALVELPVWMLQ